MVVAALPHAVRAVVGDGLVERLVRADPAEHGRGRTRRCRRCRNRPHSGYEIGLPCLAANSTWACKPVRLLDVVRERRTRRLVVGVHADDVDDVVAWVALGSTAIASAPRTGAKSNRNFWPGTERIVVTMRCQYCLPRLRVGPAAVGVRGAVHLPAEHDHGVRHAPARPAARRACGSGRSNGAAGALRAAARAPRRRRAAASLRSSIGTLRTNIRSPAARRQAVHGSNTQSGPSMSSQLCPGRYACPTVRVHPKCRSETADRVHAFGVRSEERRRAAPRVRPTDLTRPPRTVGETYHNRSSPTGASRGPR